MKFRIAIFSILTLLISACDLEEAFDQITTFTLTNKVEFTVPSSSGVNLPLDFATPDVETSSEQSFENNNTNAELVESVYLENLVLEIVSPSGTDFSFLRSIEVYISNESEGKTLLAEAQDIAENVGNTLVLETSAENLGAYIKEDSYDLSYEATLRETNNSDIDIEATMDFEVKAKVLQ